jgi:hypothetical protein
MDRQRLKKTEDKVLDLMIIFESLYNTISKLQQQCKLHCIPNQCRNCKCSNIIEEFEEQMADVQVNLRKVKVLYKRVRGTAHLV